MAKIKYRPTRITVEKDTQLKEIFDDIDKFLTQDGTKLREELEKQTRTSIKSYVDFFSNPFLRPKLSIQLQTALEQFEAGSRDDAVWVSTSLIRKEYNDAVYKLSGDNRTQAHVDFSVISNHFAIVYYTLARLPAMVDGEGVQIPVRETRRTAKGNYELVKGAKRTLNQGEIKSLIEGFRRLYIMALAVVRNPITNKQAKELGITTTPEFVRNSLNRYFDGLSQRQHEITKSKHIDVITGKAEQKLVYKEQTEAGKDSEYDMGIMASVMKQGKVKNNDERRIRKVFLALMNDYSSNFMAIKGSKRVDKEILEQTLDIAQGKKPKAYRSNTVKTKTTKAKFKNPIDNKLQKAAAKALAVKSIKRIPKSRKALGQKDDRKISEKDILKLKRIINRKLPAQVRRNMGRPALINRTGRFSNSVKLENLRRGPNTLIGEYSYQYNPYATFESRGARQWPVGYNPKPLITKSIRDIAIKHTEERFTLRRQ